MKGFMKKVLAGTLSMAMVLSVGAISGSEQASAAKKVTVKKVTVSAPSGKTAYIAKGKKVKLTTTVKVTPNKSANKKVTYKSANKKIATVNSKGYVKGVKAGKTKITVVSKKNKKKKATISVVVKKSAVSKVTVSATKATLAVGATKKLTAKVTPKKDTSSKVTWSSSQKKVATVSSKGVVKGISEGTATITAKAADGSNKKATCKVTVGAGIQSVTVPTRHIVRVSLTSAKALTAADFTIQQKRTANGQYNNTKVVEQVTTQDGGKTYDVQLEDGSTISGYSYLKVTVPSLKVDNTKEIFVSEIQGYEYEGSDTVTRVTSQVNKTYDESWYIAPASEGYVKYTVTGLPEGLKAYVGKEGTSVQVKGKFKKVEDGTTAVLTGVDEAGKTFKRSYVFYVGDKDHIVGNVLDVTRLSFIPRNYDAENNDNLDQYDSGYNFNNADITDLANLKVAGGSGDYEYSVTGLPAEVETVSVEGVMGTKSYDKEGNYDPDGYRKKAISSGTYNVSLTVKDSENAAVSKTFPFTLTLVDGVVVNGTIKDAGAAPVKGATISGETRANAYGQYYSFSATTNKNGKYQARVIPGDYEQHTYVDYYDYAFSVGNVYTTGTVTKDITIPVHRVNFTTVAGANAYRISSTPYVLDVYGYYHQVMVDYETRTLYAYLKAGAYEFDVNADDDENLVMAYSKMREEYGGYLDEEDFIGTFKLSGSFNVTGNASIQLTATPYTEQ